MKKHNCTEIEPLLPATAAGALDLEEQNDVHEHLDECEDCAQKLYAYEETVVHMAYAVPQIEPPDSLRSQIMAIAITKTTIVVEGTATVPFDPRASGKAEAGASSTRANPFVAVLGGFYRRVAPAALAFSVVLLVVSGTALFSMNQQMDNMRQTVDTSQQIKQVLAADGVSTMALQPTSTVNDMSGQVTMAPGKNQVVVVAKHLPKLSEGRVYKLVMLKRNANPVPAGTITVDGDGMAMCAVSTPMDPAQADGLAVSAATAGGSDSGDMMLEAWYSK